MYEYFSLHEIYRRNLYKWSKAIHTPALWRKSQQLRCHGNWNGTDTVARVRAQARTNSVLCTALGEERSAYEQHRANAFSCAACESERNGSCSKAARRHCHVLRTTPWTTCPRQRTFIAHNAAQTRRSDGRCSQMHHRRLLAPSPSDVAEDAASRRALHGADVQHCVHSHRHVSIMTGKTPEHLPTPFLAIM